MEFIRRAWAEINLNAIEDNYKAVAQKSEKTVIPVLKADAYGHGAAMVGKTLYGCGARFFAVSNIEEAVELRRADIDGEILILGYTPPELVSVLSEYDILQSVFSLEYADALNTAAQGAGVDIRCHIKLDTGMCRIGFDFRTDEFYGFDEAVSALSLERLHYSGIFMHFAVADSAGEDNVQFTSSQFARFEAAIQRLGECGFSFETKHCCNSAASIMSDKMYMDAVREGIVLYGLAPSSDVRLGEEFTPAMTLFSVISFIKKVRAGESVGYGRSYVTDKERTIATVSAGYADGIPRLLSNSGYVIVNGKKADIVGRVCMDQFCIDITDIDGAAVGDRVEIFGKNLSADVLAEYAKTIH